MDVQLMALASTAGTAVVTALTTNVWERARTAVGSLWRRTFPDRAETHALAEGMADGWRGKFLRRLAARPDVAQEVRRVLDEVLVPSLPSQPHPAPVVFNAGPTER